MNVNGTERHPYGSVRGPVLGWLRKQAPGTEFYYGDVAEELGVGRPTVSQICRSLTRRGNPPPLTVGPFSGWYKVTGQTVPEGRETVVKVNAPALLPPANGQERIGERWEVLGSMRDGNVMLRSPDGMIWEATQK
jgi:hypothetical protein